MKDRRIALLRGINVGTAKRIAMADLRKLFEALGHVDVKTLLNSGNVVFSPRPGSPRNIAGSIEKAIADKLGVKTSVILLDGKELAEAIRENPLARVADNPSRFLLLALQDSKAIDQLNPLLKTRWAPEALALRHRLAYLWCVNGIAKSPLWAAVNRAVGNGGTGRNLATMTRLLALVEDS